MSGRRSVASWLLAGALGCGAAILGVATPAVASAPAVSLVVSPGRVVVLDGGVEVRKADLPYGAVSVRQLARVLHDPTLLVATGSTVRVKVPLVLKPGTTLTVSAADTRRLELVSGPSSPASIQGSSARLIVTGTRVIGVTSDGRAAVSARGRAYIALRGTSRVVLTRTYLSNLGGPGPQTSGGLTVGGLSLLVVRDSRVVDTYGGIRATSGSLRLTNVLVDRARQSGVTVNRGASGYLHGVKLTNNGMDGLSVHPGGRVSSIAGVTASGNARWGVFGTSLATTHLVDVTVTGNGGGLRVKDCRACRLTGIRATGNHGDGVSLNGRGTTLTGLVSSSNQGAGLSLLGCSACRVSHVSATGNQGFALELRQSRGVSTRDVYTDSTYAGGILLDECNQCSVAQATLSGGAYGVRAQGLTASSLSSLRISGTDVGIRTLPDVTGLTLDASQVTSTTTHGLDLAGRSLQLHGVDVEQTGGSAAVSEVDGLTMTGSTVKGADVGLTLRGGSDVQDTSVQAVSDGVDVSGVAPVRLSGLTITAGARGIHAAVGTKVSVSVTSVAAPQEVVGPAAVDGSVNHHRLGLTFYSALAILFILVAILLEVIRSLRQHAGERSGTSPAHVTNNS